MDGLTIVVAPNGARRLPADYPASPVTVLAIARACAEILSLGVHWAHARGIAVQSILYSVELDRFLALVAHGPIPRERPSFREPNFVSGR